MTLRKQDYQSEKAVAGFLDKYFYPYYFERISRLENIENQLKGIDIEGNYKGDILLIDEKTAAHYVNKNLPTFAFELDFIGKDGKVYQGWFYDDTKLTQYYLLTWIWAKREKYFSTEDITKLEIILIKRSKIRKMLIEKGLTKNKAQHISSNLRLNQNYGVSGKQMGKPFYFYFTRHLSEKPINIIVYKRELIKIGTLYKTIIPE